MKNSLMICITLAVMFSIVSCSDRFGIPYLVTPSNADPNSCLLNLSYVIASNKVTFNAYQYIPDPINRSCTFQDITSNTLWYNLPFTPVAMGLAADPNNANHFSAIYRLSDIKAALGTSCMILGTYGGQLVYTCRFRYSSMNLYMNFWMTAADNSTFDTSAFNTLMTEMATTKTSTMYNQSVWIPNPNDPHLVGKIEDGCGINNWDNVINNQNTTLTIEGTTYFSTADASTFDIQNYLGGATIFNVITLQAGANPNTYKNHQTANSYGELAPFNNLGTAKCTDTGLKYGDILSNWNYCDGGCALSLMTQTGGQAFIIVTNGIHTPARNLRA